jgi:signal transduction histidine kinase
MEPAVQPAQEGLSYPDCPLEEKLRRRERELSAIRRITTALHARTNLDELERQALEVAIETVDGASGTIYIHDPAKHVLIFKYVVGETPEITAKLQGMEIPDDRGIAGEVWRMAAGRITLDVTQDQSHDRNIDAQTQYTTKSIVTVPLKSTSGQCLGVLQVLNRRRGVFDAEDLDVLEVISSQAASAIETARLHAESRRAGVVNLIGDISHDVKNMLTPVVTGTQTLEIMMDSMYEDLDRALLTMNAEEQAGVRFAADGVRDFYKEAMEMVYEGARDAQERVREIADAIKGMISLPHFELADFRERAESVTKVLRLTAEQRGIAIDLSGIEVSEPVELDRKGIYNALYNLINNAITEMPNGGLIAVRARPAGENGRRMLEIQVADNGRGIPPQVRERLFTPNAISTKPGGTGLGTTIVKNVIETHHGTISVESEVGKGSTFTIRIPMRQPARSAPAVAGT